jgi:hypothetical protein
LKQVFALALVPEFGAFRPNSARLLPVCQLLA